VLNDHFMKRKIPEFSYSLIYNIYLLLATLGFALFFVAFYSPFGLTIWYVEGNKIANFAFASIVLFSAFGFFFFLRVILYLISKKVKFNYLQYVLWIIAELLLFVFLYSLYTRYVLNDQRSFYDIFIRTSFYTFMILLIPYSFSFLYLNLLEKSKQLTQLKSRSKLKKGFMSIQQPGNKIMGDLINFYDENDVLRLSVKLFNLYYVESDLNYVTVYYTQNEELKSFTLRSSLSKIENDYASSPLIRSHRSFLINFDKVKSFQKEKEGGIIELDHPGIPSIPVSKTYIDVLLQKFKSIHT